VFNFHVLNCIRSYSIRMYGLILKAVPVAEPDVPAVALPSVGGSVLKGGSEPAGQAAALDGLVGCDLCGVPAGVLSKEEYACHVACARHQAKLAAAPLGPGQGGGGRGQHDRRTPLGGPPRSGGAAIRRGVDP